MRRKKISKKTLPSWRKAIQDRKSKQLRLFVKWACLFLGIFLLVNFFIEVFKNVRFSSWDGKEQFSLVIVEPESVLLLVLKPEIPELVLVKAPGNTVVDGALGFGEVKIGSLTGLAEIEPIPIDELVLETVKQNFGVPVEGFLQVEKRGEDLRTIFFLGLIRQNRAARTNLTRLELIRVLWFLKGLRVDQIQIFDLKETRGLVLQKQPDGSEIYKINREEFDIFINRYFSNQQLVDEEITWEVFNATGQAGLAEMVARLLKNSGSMVVGVGTLEKAGKVGPDVVKAMTGKRVGKVGKEERSGLWVEKELKDSYGVGFWSLILGLSVIEGLPEEARADAAIVLGEDFWEKI